VNALMPPTRLGLSTSLIFRVGTARAIELAESA
jgi:hypothetical protein